MKIFRAVTERDGKTTKVDGTISTEIIRSEYRYAADSIQEVWHEIAWIHDDVEQTLVAIHEEHPAVTVLPRFAKEQP